MCWEHKGFEFGLDFFLSTGLWSVNVMSTKYRDIENTREWINNPISIGHAWELRPKSSNFERRPVLSSGSYINWDSDETIMLSFWSHTCLLLS